MDLRRKKRLSRRRKFEDSSKGIKESNNQRFRINIYTRHARYYKIEFCIGYVDQKNLFRIYFKHFHVTPNPDRM